MSAFAIPIYLSLAGIISILLYIVTRRPRVKLDDGNHRTLLVLVFVLLGIGLGSAGLMMWDLYGR